MKTRRDLKTLPIISIISSFYLLHFISAIQASQICPNNCICSSLQDSLLSAQCKQFPHLDQLTDDLHILQIESAQICPISRNLQKFTQLNTLSVSNCAVDVNSNSLKNLANLQNVTFHNTSIINVDPSLFEFNRHLRLVNFSSNPLKIWRHFLISASIEVIDLSYCGLEEIPKKAFSQILNLKRLILKGNRLKSLDNILPNSVDFLDLSDNNFENISLGIFRPLINLKQIDISGNPLICSCKLKLIEEYLLFKNVSFAEPIECITPTKSSVLLSEISLKNVCKLRDNLNEKAFVVKLLKRLRRSADWTKENVKRSTFVNEAEIANFMDEYADNSTEMMNVLEAKINLEGEDNELDNANGEGTSSESDDNDGFKPSTDDGEPTMGQGKDPDDYSSTSTPEDTYSDGGDSGTDESGDSGEFPPILNLNFVIIMVAVTIMLLLILVIGIVVALILKFLKNMQDAEGDSCAATACALNACEQNNTDDAECSVPMMSRRCSTRKGTTCRICPSTMSSRRSGRTCHCNRRTYSDTDTVVNDNQFDSNLTSACTTFERSSRC